MPACPITLAYIKQTEHNIENSLIGVLVEDLLSRLKDLRAIAEEAGGSPHRQHMRAFYCLNVIKDSCAAPALNKAGMNATASELLMRKIGTSWSDLRAFANFVDKAIDDLMVHNTETNILGQKTTKQLLKPHTAKARRLLKILHAATLIVRRSFLHPQRSLKGIGSLTSDAMGEASISIDMCVWFVGQLIQITEEQCPTTSSLG
jgi:hypothetical protein